MWTISILISFPHTRSFSVAHIVALMVICTWFHFDMVSLKINCESNRALISRCAQIRKCCRNILGKWKREMKRVKETDRQTERKKEKKVRRASHAQNVPIRKWIHKLLNVLYNTGPD